MPLLEPLGLKWQNWVVLFWTNKTINIYFSKDMKIPFTRGKTVKILSREVESFAIDVVFRVKFSAHRVGSKESKKLYL